MGKICCGTVFSATLQNREDIKTKGTDKEGETYCSAEHGMHNTAIQHIDRGGSGCQTPCKESLQEYRFGETLPHLLICLFQRRTHDDRWLGRAVHCRFFYIVHTALSSGLVWKKVLPLLVAVAMVIVLAFLAGR